jgi:hypothetical protein
MRFGTSQWKWGDEPPAWIMKEFKKALWLMGKNNEAIHLFNTAPGWTFVIAIASTGGRSDALARLISDAIAGMTINSETYFPGPARPAVHGDFYQ